MPTSLPILRVWGTRGMSSWRGGMALGCHPPYPNPASPPAAAPQTGGSGLAGGSPSLRDSSPPHEATTPTPRASCPALLRRRRELHRETWSLPSCVGPHRGWGCVGTLSVNASLFIPPQVVAWRHRGTDSFALGRGVWGGVSGEYNLTSISRVSRILTCRWGWWGEKKCQPRC